MGEKARDSSIPLSRAEWHSVRVERGRDFSESEKYSHFVDGN
jgi:hypothetical protein